MLGRRRRRWTSIVSMSSVRRMLTSIHVPVHTYLHLSNIAAWQQKRNLPDQNLCHLQKQHPTS